MKNFVWLPGSGIDDSAQNRLQLHLQRPSKPMGEAWFMGPKRRMYWELLEEHPELSPLEIQEPLGEIASGTSSFGPREEWNSWYHYLLGQYLARSHEYFTRYVLEDLISAFIAIYPNGIQREPYVGFKQDVLLTLGSAIMDRYCWSDSEIVIGKILHRSNNNPNRVWCWWNASGDFSSSMFFCLKYLPEPLVAGWFKSVLAIPSPHWRAQLIVWLVGAHDLLTNSVQWPSQLAEDARPSVYWQCSHCLRPELATNEKNDEIPSMSLLPDSARTEVLRIVREHITEDVFLHWLLSISEVSYLEAELAEVPSTFEQIYLDGACN